MSAATILPPLARRVTVTTAVVLCALVVQAVAVLSDSASVTDNTFATPDCITARVRQVQSGEVASTTDGPLDVPIAAVDPERAFLHFSLRSTGSEPPDAMLRGTLSSPTSLTFTRDTDAGAVPTVTIAWTVVEYVCGVRVQRGTYAGPGGPDVDLAIDAVTPGQAFALVSANADRADTTVGATDHLRSSLPDTTTLRLSSATGLALTVDWQVVEFTKAGDVTVQQVTGALAAGEASTSTVLGAAVDPTRTMVLGSATGSVPMAGLAVRPSLRSATTVGWDRSVTTQSVTTAAWVVEFGDGTTVQHGELTLAAGQTVADAALSPVDPTTTSVLATGVGPGGQAYGQTDSGVAVLGEVQATFSLADATTVRVQRAATTSASTFTYQAVQWGGPRWWDLDWGTRQQVVVEGTGADAPAGYTIPLTFDHAAMVAAGTSRADGADLRLLRWDGSTWTELDRVLDDASSFGAADTTIWFRTEDPVAADGIDHTYWLYAGNPVAGPPPADPDAVWLYADDFADGSLSEYTDHPTPWYDAEPWSYRRVLSVPAGRVAQDLTDFPVRVAVTDAGLVGVARTDGGDLRFTAADGTTALDHELVAWDPATGTLDAWVRLPVVAAGSSTVFHLYAGAADAPDQQDVHGTWSNGYLAVWHLSEDPDSAPLLLDSGPQDLDLVPDGAVASAAGGALGLSGGGVAADAGPVPAPRTALTVSAVATPTTPGTLVAHGTDWALGTQDDGGTTRVRATVGSGIARGTAVGGAVAAGDHVAARYDGTVVHALLDGVAVATASLTGPVDATADARLVLGALGDGSDAAAGTLDEVRVAATARSDAWLAAEAATTTAPTSFVTLGGASTGTFLDPGDWAARLPVQLDGTAVTSTVSDAVVLLRVTDAALAARARPDGADLVVTGADGVARLPHELVSFDAGSGAAVLWVRVPTLAAGQDTLFQLYFDNPVATDQGDPQAVYADDAVVLHLGEDPTTP